MNTNQTVVEFKSVDFTAPHPPHANEMVERNAVWCRLYEEGKSSTEIGDQYGVSRERVCQVLRKANLIEHKWQRRRLAAELHDQDRAVVKEERGKREIKLIEFVQAGDSIATAASKVGFTVPVANWVCKKRNVKSRWGRWLDYSARKDRLKQLVDAGYPITRAIKIVSEEEGKIVAYNWVQHNCPELLRKNRPRPIVQVPPRPVQMIVRPSPSPPEYPIIDWTEERVARLLNLWFAGASSQQVADIFGDCTKNAVIGQVHRLRVAGKLKAPA